MNNPIAFEQDEDPSVPFGTGTFRFEDGSSLYAMEPELAQQVTQLHGQKLAQNDPVQEALHRRLQSAGPPPGTGDPNAALMDAPAAAGMALPPEASDDASLPAHMRMAPPAAPPPAPMGPPLPPGGVQPPAPAPRKPPPRPMVHFAGRNPAAEAAAAVPVPTKAQTVIEAEGAPYDLEMARAREGMNQRLVAAKSAEFEAQAARHMDAAARHAAVLPVLEQKAAEKRKAFDDLKAVAKKERDRVNKYIADYEQKARVDPAQLYRSGYGIPAIAMIIGQSLGAYAAVLGGGDNFAMRAASEAWQTNLENQRNEIEQGRINNKNMLARLADEYDGDLEQAESAWKILHSELLDREIQAYAELAASGDAERAAEVWKAQNAQYRFAEEQKFFDQSIGKRTQTTSFDMAQPRAPGSRPMTDAELEEAQIKANERGVRLHKSENELQFQRRGGERAPKGADPALYVEGYGEAKTKEEAVALRREIADYQAREKELDRVAELNENAWSAVGVDLPIVGPVGSEEYTESQQLAERSATATARSYGGPITQSDRDAAKLVTPDARKIVGNQDVRIQTARKANRDLLNERIRSVVSGNHAELPDQRKKERE